MSKKTFSIRYFVGLGVVFIVIFIASFGFFGNPDILVKADRKEGALSVERTALFTRTKRYSLADVRYLTVEKQTNTDAHSGWDDACVLRLGTDNGVQVLATGHDQYEQEFLKGIAASVSDVKNGSSDSYEATISNKEQRNVALLFLIAGLIGLPILILRKSTDA